MTPAELLVFNGVDDFNSNCPRSASSPEALRKNQAEWLRERIKMYKEDKRLHDGLIQSFKFALCMTGRWFDGLTRETNKVSVNVDSETYDLTFELREVQEAI